MSRYLLPVAGHRIWRRLAQLVAGLVLFGAGIGLMLQSGLGVPPWDVLHQGLALRLGLTVGIWSIVVSVVVLLMWLPLRERFGLGTLLNAIVIGVMIDVTVALIPGAAPPVVSWVMLLVGVLTIGVGSGMYIGANLGPGPRDGLMTGIARRGPSIRLTRSILEVTVLVIGWALGGTFGAGTVIFAFAIGPLVQLFLPRWTVSLPAEPAQTWHPAR